MASILSRPPKLVLLALAFAGVTLLSGCVGYDDYTYDYWARPDYSYAHNGDYDRYYKGRYHRPCHGTYYTHPRRQACYIHTHYHHNLDYGFSDL